MKPVFIILQGPSVKNLERSIERLRDYDCLWVSLNKFKVVEDEILSKINRKLDMVYYSNIDFLKNDYQDLQEYLYRPYNKTFVTSVYGIDFLFKKDYRYPPRTNIIYSSYNIGQSEILKGKYYNSLTGLLLTLTGIGYRDFVLFGADGGGKVDDLYFGHDHRKTRDGYEMSELQSNLLRDVLIMNESFWKEIANVTTDKISIKNISPDSALECFEKLDYESFYKKLSR